ncbi:MAG: hypothetical protein JNK78_11270 [Planctomycetes bacterium]|nr:hypothetical protein [Planctomycetota bacterium]
MTAFGAVRVDGERRLASFGARCMPAVAVVLAALCSYGAAAATRGTVVVPLVTAPVWLVLARLAHRRAPQSSAPALRATVVLACAHAATMLGVFAVRIAVGPTGAVHAHPAPGQHPVRERVGFPWPGVEGNGHGLAHEFIPIAMGVDALLCNLAIWTIVFGLVLRRRSTASLRDLLGPATALAALFGVLGGWHLVYLFD